VGVVLWHGLMVGFGSLRSSRVELLLSSGAPGTVDPASYFDSLDSRIRLFAIIAIRAYIKAREAPLDGDVRANLRRRETIFKGLYEESELQGINLKETFLRYVQQCGGDICLRGLTGIYEYCLDMHHLESDEAEYASDEFYIRRFVLGMVYICFLYHQEELAILNQRFLSDVKLFGLYYELSIEKEFNFKEMFDRYVEIIGGRACSARMSHVYDLMLNEYQQGLSDSDTYGDSRSERSDEDG
jgi:hypothetical protein